MIIRINNIIEYRNLNLSKKSKYHKYNLIKLGWNRSGKLDLTGINLYNSLNKSRNLWYFFEFKIKHPKCDYISDVIYFSEEIQRWVHKKENIIRKNKDYKFEISRIILNSRK